MIRVFVGLAICSLLAVPVAGAWTTDADLRAATSTLAGREVGVRCVSDKEGAWRNIWGIGMVDSPGVSDFVWLYSEVCDGMLSLLRDEADNEVYQADALSVVIHEVGHLRGIHDEARAQRYAMRNFRKAAIRLGASPAAASRMLAYAIETHMILDKMFIAPGCRKPWINEDGHLRGCK